MKNDPEDIRQTAAGDPHYAGTEPDGGCRGGRGIPELCLSAGTGQVCAEHHGGAAAGKGTACAGGASASHRTGIEKAEVCIIFKSTNLRLIYDWLHTHYSGNGFKFAIVIDLSIDCDYETPTETVVYFLDAITEEVLDYAGFKLANTDET